MDTPFLKPHGLPGALLSPPLVFADGHCFLSGMLEERLALWDLKKRRETAKANVASALREISRAQVVFLGIEHLEFITEGTFAKPPLVIEKCRPLYEHYGSPASSLAHVLVGNKGVIPPSLSETHHKQVFYYADILPLALQLKKLQGVSFKGCRVYELEKSPADEGLNILLKDLIRFFEAREDWLLKNREILNELSPGRPTQPPLILAQGADTPETLQAIAGNILRQANIIPLSESMNLPMIQFLPDHERPFEDAFLNADRVLDELRKGIPQALACRNLQMNYRLEFSLILGDILARVPVPLYFLMTDWSTCVSAIFLGGWSLNFIPDLYPGINLFYFSMYPFQAAVYHREPVSFLPFHFASEVRDVWQPLETGQLARDIGVIHQTRADTVEETPFAEFYDFLVAHCSDLDASRFIYEFLYLWRKSLQPTPEDVSAMVNLCEWHFYSKLKVERLKGIVSACTDYKIELFGNFSRFFPAAVCRDVDYGLREVREVYRSSLVTVDVKPMYSLSNLATVNSVQCIASGGLPVIFMPSFDADSGLGYEFSNRQNFIAFSTAQELRQILDALKQAPAGREAFIRRAQSGWLKDLIEGRYFTPIEELKKKPFPRIEPSFEREWDQDLLNWLFRMSAGFLLLMRGYVLAALEAWGQAMDDSRNYPPSVCLLMARYLLKLSQRGKALDCVRKSLEQNPSCANLSEFLRREGGI